MSFFEFPHTRTYDSDLGWLIKTVIKIKETLAKIDTGEVIYRTPINALIMGVDNTGVADASPKIQELLDKYHNVFLPAGTYRFNTRLLLDSNQMIFGEKGTVIYDNITSASPVGTIAVRSGAENVLISDLELTGTMNQNASHILLYIASAARVEISKIYAHDVAGIALAMAGANDVNVHDCTFLNCGKGSTVNVGALRQAIGGWENNKYVRISNCRISYAGLDGINLTGGESVTVSGCQIDHCGAGSIYLTGFNNAVVQNNHCFRSEDTGIDLGSDNMSEVVIDGNICEESGQAGISVYSLRRFIISNNICLNNCLWNAPDSGKSTENVGGITLSGSPVSFGFLGGNLSGNADSIGQQSYGIYNRNASISSNNVKVGTNTLVNNLTGDINF